MKSDWTMARGRREKEGVVRDEGYVNDDGG